MIREVIIYRFLAHSRDDGNKEVLALVETRLQILADVAFGEFNIIFCDALRVHKIQETIVDIDLRDVACELV